MVKAISPLSIHAHTELLCRLHPSSLQFIFVVGIWHLFVSIIQRYILYLYLFSNHMFLKCNYLIFESIYEAMIYTLLWYGGYYSSKRSNKRRTLWEDSTQTHTHTSPFSVLRKLSKALDHLGYAVQPGKLTSRCTFADMLTQHLVTSCTHVTAISNSKGALASKYPPIFVLYHITFQSTA